MAEPELTSPSPFFVQKPRAGPWGQDTRPLPICFPGNNPEQMEAPKVGVQVQVQGVDGRLEKESGFVEAEGRHQRKIWNSRCLSFRGGGGAQVCPALGSLGASRSSAEVGGNGRRSWEAGRPRPHLCRWCEARGLFPRGGARCLRSGAAGSWIAGLCDFCGPSAHSAPASALSVGGKLRQRPLLALVHLPASALPPIRLPGGGAEGAKVTCGRGRGRPVAAGSGRSHGRPRCRCTRSSLSRPSVAAARSNVTAGSRAGVRGAGSRLGPSLSPSRASQGRGSSPEVPLRSHLAF